LVFVARGPAFSSLRSRNALGSLYLSNGLTARQLARHAFLAGAEYRLVEDLPYTAHVLNSARDRRARCRGRGDGNCDWSES
jgi:hypothetical protein